VKIKWSFVVCLAAAWPAQAYDEKPHVRTYTNEDLERMRPQRGETGATSEPVAGAINEARRDRDRPAARGEEFWRLEAERRQRKLEPLRRRLQDLEQRLAERRSRPPGRRDGVDPVPDALLAQIRALRAGIREEESRFEDRARREGALPGWLR